MTERPKKRISKELHINSPRSELKGAMIGMVVYVGLSPGEFRGWMTSLNENEADIIAERHSGIPDGQTLLEVGEEIIENMESL